MCSLVLQTFRWGHIFGKENSHDLTGQMQAHGVIGT